MSTAHKLIEDLASTKRICLDDMITTQSFYKQQQVVGGAVSSTVATLGTKTKAVFAYLLKVVKFLLAWVRKPENWLMKRTWIGALILLRCAYLAMNEYGRNPFKKSLN